MHIGIYEFVSYRSIVIMEYVKLNFGKYVKYFTFFQQALTEGIRSKILLIMTSFLKSQ